MIVYVDNSLSEKNEKYDSINGRIMLFVLADKKTGKIVKRIECFNKIHYINIKTLKEDYEYTKLIFDM